VIEPVRDRTGRLTGFEIPAAHRALTWPQLIAFLAAFAGFIFGIMAFGSNIDSEKIRHIGRMGLPVSLAVAVTFTIWHLRAVRKPDSQPDVLAQFLPSRSIIQLGDCHLSFGASATDTHLEIVGFVQNLNEGVGSLRLRFTSPSFTLKNSIDVRPLECRVGASGVIEARCKAPHRLASGKQQRIYVDGTFHAKGKRVRFGRRRALTRRTSPWVTAIALLGGHLHVGGGYVLTFTPGETKDADAEVISSEEWIVQEIWRPA